MRVAVAGNPNAGKTTLFNALTGSRARVGNYPGVTVERRQASIRLPTGVAVDLIDLPGCYSLTSRSPEEEIAHGVLMGQLVEGKPDVVVCVVDATQMARGLYLLVQLLEMELPLVLALNMMDLAQTQGLQVDLELLQRRFGVPVVPITARLGVGLQALLQQVEQAPQGLRPPMLTALHPDEERAVQALRLAAAGTGSKGYEQLSVGACLWLLCSDLDHMELAIPTALRACAKQVRSQLDPDDTNLFKRRLITARYDSVDALLRNIVDTAARPEDPRTAALDKVLLHPVWGLVIFASTMLILFQAVFAWAEPFMHAVEVCTSVASRWSTAMLPAGHTQSLLVHGVLAGIGNVLVFVPQIAFLFFGLAILEESGYMARAAFLLDRVMRRVGLHGKAFVPLMSSFACAVPGIMAARTVESKRDRLVTIFVAPFMSCSARLPVYTLVIAAVFAAQPPLLGVISWGGLMIFCMYALGFVAALGTAFVLKKSVLNAPVPPLLLELPLYRAPNLQLVLRQVSRRCWIFIRQTGGIILALSVLLWAILTFPQQGLAAATVSRRMATVQGLPAQARPVALAQLQRDNQAELLKNSLGGRLGRALEPLIKPLGFDWRIGIGLVASFAAREVLVSTLGQVYALDTDGSPDAPALRAALRQDIDPLTHGPRFTPLVGTSLMVFFVLALQCLSTFAAVKRETNSWRWPLAQLFYMNALAYAASFLTYQGGKLLGLG